MNKQRRDENIKGGIRPDYVGEKVRSDSGYDHAGWSAVDKMMRGDHPTTNLATIACGSSSMGHYKNGGSVREEQKKMVMGGSGKHKFAAGGAGKVRKDQY